MRNYYIIRNIIILLLLCTSDNDGQYSNNNTIFTVVATKTCGYRQVLLQQMCVVCNQLASSIMIALQVLEVKLYMRCTSQHSLILLLLLWCIKCILNVLQTFAICITRVVSFACEERCFRELSCYTRMHTSVILSRTMHACFDVTMLYTYVGRQVLVKLVTLLIQRVSNVYNYNITI